MKTLNWSEYFMSLVYMVAMKSKDPNTHIGAVIVGQENEIISTGYNGLPRGVEYREHRLKTPEKYIYMSHAERNAIYNAAKRGISLNNTIMYTNGLPCDQCGIAVIQSGIKKVVVSKFWNHNNSEKWKAAAKITEEMFKDAGIRWYEYEGEYITEIYGYRRNGKINLNLANDKMIYEENIKCQTL